MIFLQFGRLETPSDLADQHCPLPVLRHNQLGEAMKGEPDFSAMLAYEVIDSDQDV